MSETTHLAPNPSLATIHSEKGKGRTIVLLSEAGCYHDLISQLADRLSESCRVVQLVIVPVRAANWSDISTAVRALISAAKIRQLSFVAFGAAGVIVQNIAIEEIKLIRSIVLVDGSTRAHPSLWIRCIDKIETKLPLGLPLRMQSKDFDGMPYLQRIRCPVLLIDSADRDSADAKHSTEMVDRLPTAWHLQLNSTSEFAQQLVTAISDFQAVPAKFPQ